MDPQQDFWLGEWQVTPLRGVLHRDGESRRLTPKAMDLLLCLLRNHGDVVERDALLDEVWQGRAQSDEPLNKCIAEIRRQFGDERASPSYIETIPKRGYRLIADYRPIGGIPNDDSAPQVSSRTSWLRYLAVAAVGGVAIFLAARIIDVDRSPESDIVSLAVLPFEVLSADASKEYFADGMHEELISALSKSRALDVRSRTSTLLYRDTQLALPAIGEALNVNMLVEGTVRQAEDTVRVSVQLVDVERDSQLWSGNYEQTLSVAEIFSIQNEIAREISTALQVTLAAPALALEQSLPTNNLQAYDFFMLGKYHYRRQLPGDIKQSVDNFEAAVALDPDFADAWDWLAYAYNHAATAVGYLIAARGLPQSQSCGATCPGNRSAACDCNFDPRLHPRGV